MSEWVRVEDRLPLDMKDVLLYCDRYKEIYFGYYSHISEPPRWIELTDCLFQTDITHWQPLPPPPESTKD